MEQIKIFDNLYMFNSYNKYIDLSFNQFLLLSEEPMLIHTGSYQMAEELVPKLKIILGDRNLSYIFVSHFESDECGGLNLLLNNFPEAKTICSAVTARQLTGFGMFNEVIIKSPEESLSLTGLNLKFISYPSEMHLWEGLLAFETERGLLFSSDLFIRLGRVNDPVVDSSLKKELANIGEPQIPDHSVLKAMQETLLKLSIKFILPGHGPVLKL